MVGWHRLGGEAVRRYSITSAVGSRFDAWFPATPAGEELAGRWLALMFEEVGRAPGGRFTVEVSG